MWPVRRAAFAAVLRWAFFAGTFSVPLDFGSRPQSPCQSASLVPRLLVAAFGSTETCPSLCTCILGPQPQCPASSRVWWLPCHLGFVGDTSQGLWILAGFCRAVRSLSGAPGPPAPPSRSLEQLCPPRRRLCSVHMVLQRRCSGLPGIGPSWRLFRGFGLSLLWPFPPSQGPVPRLAAAQMAQM